MTEEQAPTRAACAWCGKVVGRYQIADLDGNKSTALFCSLPCINEWAQGYLNFLERHPELFGSTKQ